MNDSLPFSRFLWLAALILLALFVLFGQTFKPQPPFEEPPMDAQLISLPNAAPPAPMMSPPHHVSPSVPRTPMLIHVQNNPLQSQPVSTNKLPPVNNLPQQVIPKNTVPSPQTPPVQATSTQTNSTEALGAYAIYQPKPVIPDELQNTVIHIVLQAQFDIAQDGSVKVTLLKSSPDPRLNQAILNTLKTWRFMPSTKNGMPIESLLNINIPVDVDN